MRNVQIVIERILEREGGIAQLDGENWITRFGQTPAWLENNGFQPPNNVAEAADNYERWMVRTRLAEVVAFDLAVGDLVTDFAVHSGERTAFAALQRAIGVPDDGVIGPVTLGALRRTNPESVAKRVLSQRVRFIGSLLAAKIPDRRKWARGWLNRLADQIEALP